MSDGKEQYTVTFSCDMRNFCLSTESLAKYPNSYLNQLVARNPDAVKEKQTISVDRDHTFFKWIVDLYNDILDVSFMCNYADEVLMNELMKWGLPPDLIYSSSITVKSPTVSAQQAGQKLLLNIYYQVYKDRLDDHLPLEVWVYYKVSKVIKDRRPRVFLKAVLEDFNEEGGILCSQDQPEIYKAILSRKVVFKENNGVHAYEFQADDGSLYRFNVFEGRKLFILNSAARIDSIEFESAKTEKEGYPKPLIMRFAITMPGLGRRIY